MTGERYQRAVWWLALALADTVFLWMFLSVADVDAMAATFTTHGQSELGVRMLVFAADWRHGLNGHFPLFMPGFFALTVAAWYWSGNEPIVKLLREGALALLAGFSVALVAAPSGRAAASAAFLGEFHFAVQVDAGSIWRAAPVSAFTAICWTVLIVAIRRATTKGSTRPLVLAIGLYAVLGFTRHWWSVDHFRKGNDVARWERRITQGDAVATASVFAIAFIGLLFAKTVATSSLAPLREGLRASSPPP